MACDQVPSTRQGASGFPDVLCRRLHVFQQLRGLSSITCHNKQMPPEVGGLWFLQNETCLVLPQHHRVDNPLLLLRSVDLRRGQRALPIAEAFASDEFRHLAVADRLHGRTGLHVPWMLLKLEGRRGFVAWEVILN